MDSQPPIWQDVWNRVQPVLRLISLEFLTPVGRANAICVLAMVLVYRVRENHYLLEIERYRLMGYSFAAQYIQGAVESERIISALLQGFILLFLAVSFYLTYHAYPNRVRRR
jgi:hypothetical protein